MRLALISSWPSGLALISNNRFSAARLEDDALKTFLSLRDHVTNHVSREMASVLDRLAVSDLEASQRADSLAQLIQSCDLSVSAEGKSPPHVSKANATSKTPGAPLNGLQQASPDTYVETLGSVALTNRRQCPSWCCCTCHSRRALRSPGVLADLLGELNIYYNGRNQRICSCSTSSVFYLTYRFPRFLLRRYISFMYHHSIATGPGCLLRIPAVMPWGHKLWRCLIDGDIAGVQKMYDRGLASPLDVNPHGNNSLIYTADIGSAKLVNFLIDQGVDCDFVTGIEDTASEMLWDRAYGGMFGEDGPVIARKVAWTNDNLDDMGFSTLHKIILGTVHKDLRMVLEATADSVNTTDSRGRTPLHWAVYCDDALAVETLLEFGADPNIVDNLGYVVVDFVRSSLICKLLLDAKAQIRPNLGKKGRWAIHHAVIRGTPVEVIDLLIDAGLDANVTDKDGDTALINAINWGRIEMAERLIECGADVNVSNICSQEGPIHFVGNFNRPRLLSLLLERGANYTSVNIHGHDLGHCAARFAGVEFIQIMSQSRLPGLDLDRQDRDGKTAKDYMKERVILTDREIGIHEAFEALAAKLASSSEVTPEGVEHSNKNDVEFRIPMQCDPHVPGAFPQF